MEKPFMLTYDLNSPGQRYEDFRDVIKDEVSSGWCNYWDSTFVFRSTYTPSEIIDKLIPYIDNSDSIFIAEIVNNKSGWLTEHQWDFINKNIFD
ncbi:hypothetical protein FH103_01950 [Staphylococcus hominis]|uniref:hypothetical protein n=1 Tax=Staphylococcus hominis TaxID=1290 RepID=UPI001F581C19|nr:hypothetical protein [Staphylococcus hominis]MCI2881408.1 hypothetical protein [Staphylococcus hominis]